MQAEYISDTSVHFYQSARYPIFIVFAVKISISFCTINFFFGHHYTKKTDARSSEGVIRALLSVGLWNSVR